MFQTITKQRTLRWVAAAVLTMGSLSACAPLVLGTAVGSAFVATDRRTSGMQLEDQTIEIKASNRIKDAIGSLGHVNVNAYNRWILLTGEVPTEADKTAAEQAARAVENVSNVYNELTVSLNSSLGSRSSDVLLAGKIKATLVDARDIISNAFSVVVERGDVFIMGLVTEREANRAAELAASVKGVNRVVKVMQIISEDELARKLPRPPQQ
ncbi:transporter [Aquabacterium sp. NJ1]|uniref:BON domain-containing protein n=1 Tax=Aquabacterium sp. NJ1 TaxID=1538295 RepID=UPI00052C591D|nr:BON domain-containing protein [Aquabacterium sp. NJ1]KGM39954.1 transporter [Aquabacterium sp. NJ1]